MREMTYKEEVATLLDDIDVASQKVSRLAIAEMKRLMEKHGDHNTYPDGEEYYMITLEEERLEYTFDGMYIEVNEIVYRPEYDEVEISFDEYDRVHNYHGSSEANFAEFDCRNQAELVGVIRREYGE